MKTAIIQPEFSVDLADSDRLFKWELDALDNCTEELDIIVMPEYSDVPVLAKTREDYLALADKYNKAVIEKACETARRCSALVFINAVYESDTGFRNTTYAIDREGNIVGHYFKQHLVNSEMHVKKLDGGYTYEFSEPCILELEGIRFAFLTCYDFYFYEIYANIARQNVDIIIGCSHQRSDTHSALEIINRFLAYHTNAYVIRSSVSMGEDSETGGGSCIVAPTGRVLADMKSRIGMEVADIDPKEKYYKPAGFGNPPAAHYEYIDAGRRPWKYRPGGSAIAKYDSVMPYPRAGALGYKGLPKMSLPAFGAAVAAGASEICCDIAFDCGAPMCGSAKLEDILKKLACHAVINLRISQNEPATAENAKELARLAFKYDCERHVYITASDASMCSIFAEHAPRLPLCLRVNSTSDIQLASKLGCEKVYTQIPDEKFVPVAHALGLKYVTCANDMTDAKGLFALGFDTVAVENFTD